MNIEHIIKDTGLSDGRIKTAIKRYNDIMNDLGYEHNSIGEALSENTEEWNLRDMVCECDYVLSTFYEWGHVNHDETWEGKGNQIAKLKRFIKSYLPHTQNVKCHEGHYSQYDNQNER